MSTAAAAWSRFRAGLVGDAETGVPFMNIPPRTEQPTAGALRGRTATLAAGTASACVQEDITVGMVIGLANAASPDTPISSGPRLVLDPGPEYWFLYRYFEAANVHNHLAPGDRQGVALIEGYSMQRLQRELEQALVDVECMPEAWVVVMGWDSGVPSVQADDWHPLQKSVVRATIQMLLDILWCSATFGLKVVVRGN